MAIDRQLKKKKKREEKQKARRQQVQRQLLDEKAEECEWEAREAFQAKDYKRALSWALKKLKLQPADSRMRGLALHCTQHLREDETLYSLFCQSYQYGEQTTRHNCLILAEMAYERKHYELARELLEAVLNDSSQLTGRLPKSRQKRAKEILLSLPGNGASCGDEPRLGKSARGQRKTHHWSAFCSQPFVLHPRTSVAEGKAEAGTGRFLRPNQKPCRLSKSPSRPRPAHSSKPCRRIGAPTRAPWNWR